MEWSHPTFVTSQNGHFQIVSHLLEKQARPELAFNTTVKGLHEFAKHYNCQETMKAFIAKKQATDNVSMTPEDIAVVMGHHSIAAQLRANQYMKKIIQGKDEIDIKIADRIAEVILLDRIKPLNKCLVRHPHKQSLCDSRTAWLGLIGELINPERQHDLCASIIKSFLKNTFSKNNKRTNKEVLYNINSVDSTASLFKSNQKYEVAKFVEHLLAEFANKTPGDRLEIYPSLLHD